ASVRVSETVRMAMLTGWNGRLSSIGTGVTSFVVQGDDLILVGVLLHGPGLRLLRRRAGGARRGLDCGFGQKRGRGQNRVWQGLRKFGPAPVGQRIEAGRL